MTTKSLNTDPQKRLLSLDALRGFDMFWITGGSALFFAISVLTGTDWLGNQMRHVEWAGFGLHDLIFPVFMFIAGIAIPFSIQSKLEKNIPQRRLFLKALKRGLALILLGILYNGTFSGNFLEGRMASVLGQIGIAYFFAAVITIYFPGMKSKLFWLGGILIGISIIQLFIPVPGIGAGILTPEGCINGYIDRALLPGTLCYGTFDPEGILCSLSATGITLMGTLAGHILRNKKTGDWKKLEYLAIIGVAGIILAISLSSFYPIIKKCWTTTFNLLAGGIGFLLIALFYLIIDHWGFQKWAFYFRVIGMNCIFVYLFNRMVSVPIITNFFLGGIAKPFGSDNNLILLIGNLIFIWLLLYYMYKKKIFLRL